MKLLLDFFPVLLFFVVFKLHEDPQEGILTATAVLIVASLAQIAFSWLKWRRVEKMHLVTAGLVVVLGSVTLVLKDGIFVQWKPTVVYWLFAVAFLVSQYLGQKNFTQRMMGTVVDVPDMIWRRLNLSCVVFFAALGVLNLYVVYHYDMSTWVSFKLYGLLGITFAFFFGMSLYIMRHMKDEGDAEEKS